MKIIMLQQIKEIVPTLELLPAIEMGFVAYSSQQAVVPPVGELLLDKGEVHIKYGYLKQDPYYVIKIASGFYDNPKLGLPSGNGLLLLFRQDTGELVSVLLDEGYLTDLRTAIAGAIVAKHLANKKVNRIGIVGTGTQAKLQLEQLKGVTDCRKVLVWGRGEAQLERYRRDMEPHDFKIKHTLKTSDILHECNLIVTTTPAKSPLLHAVDLQSGTHITAVGSDTQEKQEVDAEILRQADVVVADSISQCLSRGEIYKSIQTGHITEDKIVELGDVISGKSLGRTSEAQVTLVDLTGVAVQDIKIASTVYQAVI
jgi:ornithine cyclodeaminase